MDRSLEEKAKDNIFGKCNKKTNVQLFLMYYIVADKNENKATAMSHQSAHIN